MIYAIYARVSKKEDSNRDNSLENQVHLLKQLAARDVSLSQGRAVVFMDDGYSGMKKDRPAWKKMLAGLFLGKYAGVLVKDFSRLSRDHLWLCKFREVYLVQYPFFCIAWGDGYDSRRGSERELAMGIRSIYNSYYCLDVSRKVKLALDAKKRTGEYAVNRVPYGYRRDDRGKILIDTVQGNLVKKMFALAESGKSYSWIAARLSEETKRQWYPARVWQILHNSFYTGEWTWHKYENVYRMGFVTEQVDPEEQMRVPNHHPALISQETFQKIGSNHTVTRERKKPHCFHRLTRCSGCGSALNRGRRDGRELECPVCRAQGGKRISLEVLEGVCDQFLKEYLGWEITKPSARMYRFFIHEIWLSPNGNLYIEWEFSALRCRTLLLKT